MIWTHWNYFLPRFSYLLLVILISVSLSRFLYNLPQTSLFLDRKYFNVLYGHNMFFLLPYLT